MKIAIISSRAPYGSTLARDALETLLVAASYDLETTILFMGDGVFQLLNNQSPGTILQKNIGAMLQALEMYGVENILVCQEDLQERGLAGSQLLASCHPVSRSKIPGILRDQERVLNF